MSAGKSWKYRILDISGHHFVETGREGGMGPAMIFKAIRDMIDQAKSAPDRTLDRMPTDFATDIHESVGRAIRARLPLLEAGLNPV